MNIECPHCHKNIELMGAGEIKQEFRVPPNTLAKDEKEGLVAPVIKLPNRFLYLRDAVLDYVQAKNLKEIDRRVGPIAANLLKMPPSEQAAAVRRIQEMLEGATNTEEEPKTRPRRTARAERG